MEASDTSYGSLMEEDFASNGRHVASPTQSSAGITSQVIRATFAQMETDSEMQTVPDGSQSVPISDSTFLPHSNESDTRFSGVDAKERAGQQDNENEQELADADSYHSVHKRPKLLKSQVKRPCGKWILYIMENRQRVTRENPELAIKDVTRLMGEMYRSISAEESTRLDEMVKREKERYQAELADAIDDDDDDEAASAAASVSIGGGDGGTCTEGGDGASATRIPPSTSLAIPLVSL